MSMVVLEQHLAAQIQDMGRRGVLAQGYSSGGPMDEIAYRWNAQLLGNALDASQIEVYQGGFKVRFDAPSTIALTGGDQNSTLNARRIANWSTHKVHAGDVLTMRTANYGVRAYLGIVGGFQVEPQLGATSTVQRLALGGLSGGVLQPNDVLEYSPNDSNIRRAVRWEALPDYQAPLSLHLVLGYQSEFFPSHALEELLMHPFTVSTRNDRMGIHIEGPPIEYTGPTLPSEGLGFGAVQIPQGGEPIILMRDAQSIGGYPKIGSIFSLDCAVLAQQPPGTTVRFTLIEPSNALAIRNRVLHAISTY